MRLTPHALRWRLTLWYSLGLCAMLAACAGGSWYTLRQVLASRADRFLEDARDAFLVELSAERAAMPTTTDAIRAAMRDIRFSDIEFIVLDSASRVVATSWTIPRSSPAPPAVAGPRLPSQRLIEVVTSTPAVSTYDVRRLVTIPGGDGGHRVAVAVVALDGAPSIIAAAQSRRWLLETLRAVTFAYLAAIPAVLLLAAGGGYLLARRALAPVGEMGRRARSIEARSLHERLPVEDPHDELGGLATVFNDLLRRLESAFAQQHRLVADASHELRTPVAVVRAEADVALSQPQRSAAEYRESLRVIEGAGRRLSRIVDDLFLLARADGGPVPLRGEPLYFDELVEETVHVLRALAAQRGVRIDVAPLPELPVLGDPELLGRLLINLLENAVKYSSAGSVVSVRLDRTDGAAALTVADQGSGIPADAQARVFERFFRADSEPSAGPGPAPGGAGLGLAIARWVAEAHGGALDLVRSSPEGSEFRVTLPLDTSSMAQAEKAVDAVIR
ncbi:MAG: sensor histidine kinase [Gemmatimonadaceae bacterium]